ncbi:MAG: TerB family tellurite resistance protein [Microthrixaceae bacterium]|nr:TerB family tellurite resistance protein [Microthrixaceae bacterium]
MDRLNAIADILMGAAHADGRFNGKEEAVIRKVLGDLLGQGGVLPAELDARLRAFKSDSLDLPACAAIFHTDELPVRRMLLEVIASINEADEEIDLDEDSYLKRVAEALQMPADSYGDLALKIEISDAKDALLPPTPPKA